MAVAQQGSMDSRLIDPVTKAVVDNIMGNLPTRKPLVRCGDCDLCFTSQTVLDAHLQGARHAKQIRSKVIMATLEETKVAFTKDQEANGLRCNVCNVSLNSIQQLQTHLNGNRHKKKATKGGWMENEVIQTESTPASCSGNFLAPSPNKESEILSCEACNKFFNSKAQYDVHTASRKHAQKQNRIVAIKSKKKRFLPYQKRTKYDHGHQMFDIPILTNNYIPGGYANNY